MHVQRLPIATLERRSTDTYAIMSIVIPLMVALDLTILGILLAVVLGFAWELDASRFFSEDRFRAGITSTNVG